MAVISLGSCARFALMAANTFSAVAGSEVMRTPMTFHVNVADGMPTLSKVLGGGLRNRSRETTIVATSGATP